MATSVLLHANAHLSAATRAGRSAVGRASRTDPTIATRAGNPRAESRRKSVTRCNNRATPGVKHRRHRVDSGRTFGASVSSALADPTAARGAPRGDRSIESAVSCGFAIDPRLTRRNTLRACAVHLPTGPFMNSLSRILTATLAVLALSVTVGLALAQTPAPAPAVPPADPWPRVVDLKNGQVLVYQPQVNKWDDNRIDFRCALAIKPDGREGRDVRRDLRHRAHAGRQGRAHRRVREPQDHEDRFPDAARSRRGVRGRAAEANSRRACARSRSTGSSRRSRSPASSRRRSTVQNNSAAGASSATRRRSWCRSTARRC